MSSALTALASMANASNSQSTGISDSSSYGISGSQSNSIGESWSDSWVNGTLATAEDRINAQIANDIQTQNWLMQAAYNSAQAKENRMWQEQMSNTAYQRAVNDLKKAGLNPILAAQNMGASTGSGAQASAGLSNASKANATADSGSRSYSYNKSNSRSYSKEVSSSHSENQSTRTTQLKDLIGTITNVMGNASAQDVNNAFEKGILMSGNGVQGKT